MQANFRSNPAQWRADRSRRMTKEELNGAGGGDLAGKVQDSSSRSSTDNPSDSNETDRLVK